MLHCPREKFCIFGEYKYQNNSNNFCNKLQYKENEWIRFLTLEKEDKGVSVIGK